MMKKRFRAIFFHTLEVHHTFAPNVIAACAVLHNICLGVGDVVAPEDNTEEDEGEEDTVSAAQWRDRLSAEMSALEEVQMHHEYLSSYLQAVLAENFAPVKRTSFSARTLMKVSVISFVPMNKIKR
uniref:DDE Tnp4 domain-containing protein n=1 Tax=Knipowitschia caucasica TaxID=637954 RepID=A0AAV2LK49_KNICA